MVASTMKDDKQPFKQFMDDDSFKRRMTNIVFELTVEQMTTDSGPGNPLHPA